MLCVRIIKPSKAHRKQTGNKDSENKRKEIPLNKSWYWLHRKISILTFGDSKIMEQKNEIQELKEWKERYDKEIHRTIKITTGIFYKKNV